MEEEKKKKKTKKKRGKQAKVSEDVAVSDGDAASLGQNHAADPKQNHHVHAPGDATVQNAGILDVDVTINGHQNHQAEGVNSTALLEEQVRHLEAEKQSWLQREEQLEEKIKHVALDKRSWILKESSLEEKIKHLQNEKDSLIQKEASLVEKIQHLQCENDSWRKKEVSLEEIITQLRGERDSWTLNEANLEDKIKHLESGNDSRILKENSAVETVARLNEVNTGLQAQVKELEESRNSLLKENRRLVEHRSHLELRILHLEADGAASSAVEMKKHANNEEDPSSLVEAARALVEKLVVENAELVEKVNELFVELDRLRTTPVHSPEVKLNPAIVMAGATSAPDFLADRGERVQNSNEVMSFGSSLQNIDKKDTAVNNVESQYAVDGRVQNDELLGSFKPSESSVDIVQVPLDKNEIQEVEITPVPLEENEIGKIEPRVLEAGENASVPLSDAPLIGAPFRLISFFANYVSGADLVYKNSSDAGR